MSPLPESTRVPSGENTTDVTRSECPSNVRSSAPAAVSHSLSVLSRLPDSTLSPSGENATEETVPECGISSHNLNLGRALGARPRPANDKHRDCHRQPQPAQTPNTHGRTPKC